MNRIIYSGRHASPYFFVDSDGFPIVNHSFSDWKRVGRYVACKLSQRNWILFDENGNILHEKLSFVGRFSFDKWGLLSLEDNYLREDGSLLLPPSSVDEVFPFSDGYGLVRDGWNNYYFIDVEGNKAFGSWERAYSFSSGLAAVKKPNHRWNFLKTDGTFLLKKDAFQAFSFCGRVGVAKFSNNRYVAINPAGEELFAFSSPPQFDENGVFATVVDGKVLLYRDDGKIIKTEYDKIGLRDEIKKWIPVRKDEKINLINRDGERFFSEDVLGQVFSVFGDVALVKRDDEWAYVKRDGTILFGESFADATTFNHFGISYFYDADGRGNAITKDGKKIFEKNFYRFNLVFDESGAFIGAFFGNDDKMVNFMFSDGRVLCERFVFKFYSENNHNRFLSELKNGLVLVEENLDGGGISYNYVRVSDGKFLFRKGLLMQATMFLDDGYAVVATEKDRYNVIDKNGNFLMPCSTDRWVTREAGLNAFLVKDASAGDYYYYPKDDLRFSTMENLIEHVSLRQILE